MFLLGITSLSIEFTRLAIEEMKQPMYLDAALELNPQFCGIMMPITLKMAFLPIISPYLWVQHCNREQRCPHWVATL